MKLIGSTTSPYVRKVRLLLGDTDYEFETLKALTPEGSKLLETYGPVKRIPILLIDGKQIFDSTIICDYLLEKQGTVLTVDDKLNLRLIDELCDSCIILFQQKAWQIDPDWQNEMSTRMLSRAFGILDTIEQLLKDEQLSDFQRDWLYCVIDWLSFRSVINWEKGHPEMQKFYNKAKLSPRYQSTSLKL